MEVGETAMVSESWRLDTNVTDHDRTSVSEGVGSTGKDTLKSKLTDICEGFIKSMRVSYCNFESVHLTSSQINVLRVVSVYIVVVRSTVYF